MKKLNFELVPDGCWFQNLRTVLSKKQWDYIKSEVKKDANGKCEICGKSSSRLEAHERWNYDEKTATQKLVGVIAVCPDCHHAIHINRTYLKGDGMRAEDHYMKVNGCSYAEMRADMGKANEEQKRLNEVSEWKLDLTYLKRFTK